MHTYLNLKPIQKWVFAALLLFFPGFLSFAMAQGNLLVTPKRVVFDGQKRSQDITLANIGTDSARYAVSFIQLRMKSDGSVQQITQPDSAEHFADKNLRIYPRIITLGPKETQVVKIQTSQASSLQAGEYRSHLYFRAIPIDNFRAETASPVIEKKGVAVQLTPIFGISIPIIIRNGQTNVHISLTDLKFEEAEQGRHTLKLTINRTGNISAYGDISVQYLTSEGKISQLAIVKGISVYSPNASRDMKVNWENNPSIDYRKGKLRVVYTSAADLNSFTQATAEIALN